MEFRIADTFTASLARLTGDEQKAVKMTAFDLQIDPSNPGMQLHRLDRVKDPNFWSVDALTPRDANEALGSAPLRRSSKSITLRSS